MNTVVTWTSAQTMSNKFGLDTRRVDDDRAAVISYGAGENARSHRDRRHPI